MDTKFLREYRCKNCHRLLCKGHLSTIDDALEVKCKSCGNVCLFRGEDAEIVAKRAVLIKQGLIPDTDKELDMVT
ncbi:MAG: Com family DNA-binding transcriptional regulator [Candidatus Parcubacteria bacterium]|nr:Com family DNA-binding transcriptional regulator [Candidatus Parcubacteria bacterium]